MMALFQVLVILTSVSMQAFGQRCKVTTRPEYGVALVGHVFRSFSVDRLATCYSACNVQPACQSLNFNLADKTCQFNKETKHTRPANLESKETSVYAENPDRGKSVFETKIGALNVICLFSEILCIVLVCEIAPE